MALEEALVLPRSDVEGKAGRIESAGGAFSLIDETKLSQVLEKREDVGSEAGCAVVLRMMIN